MIGVIALVEIAVNDAIVMIETMNQHRAGGMRPREAPPTGFAPFIPLPSPRWWG